MTQFPRSGSPVQKRRQSPKCSHLFQQMIALVLLAHRGAITAPYTQRIPSNQLWKMHHSIPPVATPSYRHILTHILSTLHLLKSKFWFCSYAFLQRHFHRAVQALSHTPAGGYTALEPHLGHHAIYALVSGDTSIAHSLPFTTTSTPNSSVSISSLPADGWANFCNCHLSCIPPSPANIPLPSSVVPRPDHLATVNAPEAYSAPVGISSPMNQSIAITSDSILSTTPIVIEKTGWYSDYGIARDANGFFHCPYTGCRRKNKRRDQLWEHWKAQHNNDPYRCSLWFVLQ